MYRRARERLYSPDNSAALALNKSRRGESGRSCKAETLTGAAVVHQDGEKKSERTALLFLLLRFHHSHRPHDRWLANRRRFEPRWRLRFILWDGCEGV